MVKVVVLDLLVGLCRPHSVDIPLGHLIDLDQLSEQSVLPLH